MGMLVNFQSGLSFFFFFENSSITKFKRVFKNIKFINKKIIESSNEKIFEYKLLSQRAVAFHVHSPQLIRLFWRDVRVVTRNYSNHIKTLKFSFFSFFKMYRFSYSSFSICRLIQIELE